MDVTYSVFLKLYMSILVFIHFFRKGRKLVKDSCLFSADGRKLKQGKLSETEAENAFFFSGTIISTLSDCLEQFGDLIWYFSHYCFL